jgi:hypothetical protein
MLGVVHRMTDSRDLRSSLHRIDNAKAPSNSITAPADGQKIRDCYRENPDGN